MTLRQFDYKMFHWINGAAKVSKYLDYFGVFCAVFLIWFIAALALSYFFCASKIINRLRYFFILFASVGSSYLISALIGFGYGRARPFASLTDAHQLIATSFFHKSFPSSHATVAFALAFTVFWFNRPLGVILLALAFLVAWGRVFVGVHYPFDVVVGAFLGGIVSYVIFKIIV